MSVGTDAVTVTQVAQRHEITRQQIYAWRHEMKQKGLWSPDGGALFLPFVAVPIAVELRLRNGRSLHFDSSMAVVALTQLIRAVEAA